MGASAAVGPALNGTCRFVGIKALPLRIPPDGLKRWGEPQWGLRFMAAGCSPADYGDAKEKEME
jgi:hypothetical protein